MKLTLWQEKAGSGQSKHRKHTTSEQSYERKFVRQNVLFLESVWQGILECNLIDVVQGKSWQ